MYNSWYIMRMLLSFIGTCDGTGLRSLRSEDDSTTPRHRAGETTFWAVLDDEVLPLIHQALLLGRRGTALEVLVDRAQSLGRLHG